MAFKNLEARYNEKVNQLYGAAKMKFDGGKATKGANDDPIVVRKPGDGYFGGASKALGRALPLASAVQDVKRLTLFTFSTRGVVFLLKQALLQTGNTFDRTRLINPLFTLGPAALAGVGNIVRMKRNLRPLNELVMRTDTSDQNVRKMGALQESTFKAMKEKFDTKRGRFWVELDNGQGRGKGPGLLKKLGASLATLVSGFTAKQNIWDKEGFGAEGAGRRQEKLSSAWGKIRPELATVVKMVNQRNLDFQNAYHFKDDRIGGEYEEADGTRVAQKGRFNAYFIPNESGIWNTDEGIDDEKSPKSFGIARWKGLTKKKFGGDLDENEPPKSLLRDQSNQKSVSANKTAKPYEYINSERNVYNSGWEDAITVSFAMGREDHIRFRAYITDVSQTVTPEYKTYQYVGRPEKFVTYTSVQREVSFKLSLLAFSKDELQYLWKRLNYLTGTVYSYGLNSGVYQPNIIRLTIGNLYWDQPGYFTSLNVNFNEYSWDIDQEIPIGADLDFKFVLIEKKSRIAQSPFYGITEDDPDFPTDLATLSAEQAPSADAPQKKIVENRA